MRRAGVVLLGLLGGAFIGLALTDLLAWALLQDAGPNPIVPLGPALGILTPVLAVVGIPVALSLDSRWRQRHPTR